MGHCIVATSDPDVYRRMDDIGIMTLHLVFRYFIVAYVVLSMLAPFVFTNSI